MTDLLSALAPPPAESARPIGIIDGPPGWHEGFGAGLRCWCGPVVGWRDLGEVIGGPDAPAGRSSVARDHEEDQLDRVIEKIRLKEQSRRSMAIMLATVAAIAECV